MQGKICHTKAHKGTIKIYVDKILPFFDHHFFGIAICKKKLVKMIQLYVAPKTTSMDGDLYREKSLTRITNLGSKFCFQNQSLHC